MESTPTAPARVTEAFVVAATSPNDQPYTLSNYGPEVDIQAPGDSVLTLGRSGEIRSEAGTSPAAALTSGIAAVALTQDPNQTAATLPARLSSAATPGVVTTSLSPNKSMLFNDFGTYRGSSWNVSDRVSFCGPFLIPSRTEVLVGDVAATNDSSDIIVAFRERYCPDQSGSAGLVDLVVQRRTLDDQVVWERRFTDPDGANLSTKDNISKVLYASDANGAVVILAVNTADTLRFGSNVGGQINPPSPTAPVDSFVVKLAAFTGDVIWTTRIASGAEDTLRDIALARPRLVGLSVSISPRIIVVGGTRGSVVSMAIANGQDAFIASINPLGGAIDAIWQGNAPGDDIATLVTSAKLPGEPISEPDRIWIAGTANGEFFGTSTFQNVDTFASQVVYDLSSFAGVGSWTLNSGFVRTYVAGTGDEAPSRIELVAPVGPAPEDPYIILAGTTTGTVAATTNQGGSDAWVTRFRPFPFTRAWILQDGTSGDDVGGAVFASDDVLLSGSGRLTKVSRDNGAVAFREPIEGLRVMLKYSVRGTVGYALSVTPTGSGFVIDETAFW